MISLLFKLEIIGGENEKNITTQRVRQKNLKTRHQIYIIPMLSTYYGRLFPLSGIPHIQTLGRTREVLQTKIQNYTFTSTDGSKPSDRGQLQPYIQLHYLGRHPWCTHSCRCHQRSVMILVLTLKARKTKSHTETL